MHRYPILPHEQLLAFNGADHYLLQTWFEQKQPDSDDKVLIINDNFGALGCFCDASQIAWSSDSFIAKAALRQNLQANNLNEAPFIFLSAQEKSPFIPDWVLMRLPKSLAMLEYQLALLSQSIGSHTRILAAGMTREIHNSTITLFERILGKSPTSLAWKKARLIEPCGDYPGASPLPEAVTWQLPPFDDEIANLAGVFSRDSLDIGARFFLENLPDHPCEQIVDLGCGNGVIGLRAARLHPDAHITFVDESEMAVESARINIERNLPQHLAKCSFVQDNCMESFSPQSCDMVLCNPPFHQQNSISDHIAWQMFCDARKALIPQGRLRIIGNRHLGYHNKLKKLFGNCNQIAANQKFVILESIKR